MRVGKRICIFFDWGSFCLFDRICVRRTRLHNGDDGLWVQGKSLKQLRLHNPHTEVIQENTGFNRYQIGPLGISIQANGQIRS
jgi:hypothetical protein